jgi:hypothetical protein
MHLAEHFANHSAKHLAVALTVTSFVAVLSAGTRRARRAAKDGDRVFAAIYTAVAVVLTLLYALLVLRAGRLGRTDVAVFLALLAACLGVWASVCVRAQVHRYLYAAGGAQEPKLTSLQLARRRLALHCLAGAAVAAVALVMVRVSLEDTGAEPVSTYYVPRRPQEPPPPPAPPSEQVAQAPPVAQAPADPPAAQIAVDPGSPVAPVPGPAPVPPATGRTPTPVEWTSRAVNHHAVVWPSLQPQ